MHNVMQKTQELAEAIMASSVYQNLQEAEGNMTADADAAAAIAAYMEKRQAVETLLGSGEEMDREALAKAGAELQEAEDALNSQPMVQAVQAAREAYSQMMGNVNQLLQLILTGQTEGGCSGSCESCSGSCGSCGGCQ